MILRNCLCMSVTLAAITLGTAESAAQVESSFRASAWSGDRNNTEDEDPVANLELWGRGRWGAWEGFSIHAEGWVALDPAGDGEADMDLREGYLTWRLDGVRIVAGRQLFAWGRADRLNPTDVFSARDLRRLVDDESDNRLGIGALTARVDLSGGEFSAIWAPEFRASELPQSFDPLGLPVLHEQPDDAAKQFALRYDRFGRSFDWSATYAEVLDRTPWISITGAARPDLALNRFHPKFRMIGGDIATTIGSFGVRAEAAAYDYDDAALRGAALRKPRLALVLGVDHDLPGQINVNMEGLVRTSEALPASPSQAPAARVNGAIQYGWRDTVVGGLLRVRKLFDADRGLIEASAGAFAGGGNYLQFRFGYAIADGIRLTVMAEQYAGEPHTLLGRLEDNSLVTVGIRLGY
jgi:hypothetical protein